MNFVIFYLLVFSCKSIYAQNIILGINGHAISERAPYGNAIDIQLSQLKAMGLTYYRNDVLVYANGQVDNEARFKELLRKGKQYNIHILPMLYDRWKPEFSNKQNYSNGYTLGLNFTKRYGAQLSAIEIGNEKDVLSIKNNNPPAAIPADGQLTIHYNRKMVNSIASCFAGMADGIHKASPRMKVIVNCSNHPRWGFFQILQEQKVKFDIVGIHWYTSSGNLADTYGQNGFKMFAKFKKPIWFTEYNRGGGTFNENGDDNQLNALTGFIKQIKSYPIVKALFIYELYDNNELKKQNSMEGFFGVYSDAATPKPAVDILKRIRKKTK